MGTAVLAPPRELPGRREGIPSGQGRVVASPGRLGELTPGIGKLQSLRGGFYSGSPVRENERRCMMPPAAFPTEMSHLGVLERGTGQGVC